jgi:hypothetical protein
MAQPVNIASYTAHSSDFPPFISVNRLEDGTVEIAVRGPGKFDETKNVSVAGEVMTFGLTEAEFTEFARGFNA